MMLGSHWHTSHLYTHGDASTEVDKSFINTPYLVECSTIPIGTTNSSCTTLCDSIDDPQNDSQIFKHDGTNGFNGIVDNNINGFNPNLMDGNNGIVDININGYNQNLIEGTNGFGGIIDPTAGFLKTEYYSRKHENVVSGVKFQPSDNRWIARWTTADGKRACKSFSVNIYGFEQARALAIEARHKGVSLSGRSFCNRERQHAMRSGVGIIGIRFDKTQARWVSSYYEGGKRKFRYFTVKDYGYEQAKQHAILWKTCNDERLLRNRSRQTIDERKNMTEPWNWFNYNNDNLNYYCNSTQLNEYSTYNPLDYQNVDTSNNNTEYMEQYINYINHPQVYYENQQPYTYAMPQENDKVDDCDINANEDESCSVSGVTFDRKNRRWGARWTTQDGRRNGRYFPVRQYGFNEAKRLAIICRLQAHDDICNSTESTDTTNTM